MERNPDDQNTGNEYTVAISHRHLPPPQTTTGVYFTTYIIPEIQKSHQPFSYQ